MSIGIKGYGNSYNSEIGQKRTELQAAEGEKSLFSSELDGVGAEQATAESDVVQLSSAVSDAESNVSAASSNVSAAQSALSAAQNIPGEQITNEDGTVTTDYSKRNAAIAQAQAILAQAQEALAQAQQELTDNQAAYENKLSESESLQAQIDEIQGQIDAVQSEIDSLNSEISELESQNESETPSGEETSFEDEYNFFNGTMIKIDTESVTDKNLDSLFSDTGLFGQKSILSLTSPEDEEKFKTILYQLDTDKDGKLNNQEISTLTSINDDGDDGKEITQDDLSLYWETLETQHAQTLENMQGALGEWQNNLDNIIQSYFPSKSLDEISDEDIQKAVFTDMLTMKTGQSREAIEAYFATEGKADDAYNWLKELTDLGITHDDIDKHLQNEEMFNSILAASLTNGGSLELVDSDKSPEELLEQGQMSKSMLERIIEQKIANASSLEEIMDYSESYLGLDGEDVQKSVITALIDQQLKNSPYCSQYNSDDLEFEITKGDDGQYYISTDYELISGKACNVNSLTVDEYLELYYADGIQQNADFVSEVVFSEWSDNAPDSISFEQIYNFFTGVEYSPEAIQEANDAQLVYQHVMELQQGAQYQEDLFETFDSPKQAYDYFLKMSEANPVDGMSSGEQAANMFNSYYDTLLENGLSVGNGKINIQCTSYHISSDGKTITEVYSTGQDFSDIFLQEGDIYDEKTGTLTRQYSLEYDPETDEPFYQSDSLLIFKTMNRLVNEEDRYVQLTIDGFNEMYGDNAFNIAIEDYQEKFEAAYGNNILDSKFDSYQYDMDSYSQKLSSVVSMGSFALSFINPAFGFAALGGAYLDNGIDLVNLATNNKDGEFGSWFLNTMKDVCYTAIGFKLGAMANQSGNKLMGYLMEQGVSQNVAVGIGTGGEYIIDVASGTAFDLATSLVETGNLQLSQNILNNLLFGSADFRGGIGLYRALKAGYNVDVDLSGNIKIQNPNDTVDFRAESPVDSPKEDPVPKAGVQPDSDSETPRTEMPESDNPQTVKTEALQADEPEGVKTAEGDNLPDGKKPVDEIDPLHPKLPDEQTINQRIAELEGINDPYGYIRTKAPEIAQLDDVQYSRALDLLDIPNITPDNAITLAQLNDVQYSRALDLLDKPKITPDNVITLAQLDDVQYSRALDLFDKPNITYEDVITLAQLDDVQYSRALDLFDKPNITYEYVITLAKLDDASYARALDLLDKKIPYYNLADFATDETKYKRSLECIDHKINPYFISDFLQLDDIHYTQALDLADKEIPVYQIKRIVSDEALYKRTSDLLNRNIAPNKIDEIASDPQKYNRAMELSSKGLIGNSVTDMVLSNETQYAQYDAAFSKVMEQIGENEGYSIELRVLQNDAGFQFVARKVADSVDGDGYKIGKVVTFDENGMMVHRSTVTIGNGEKGAYYSGGDRVTFTTKINGDRDIDSQIEIVNDKNGEPSYILHTKESETLPGAYETVRYDLKDYPEDMDVLGAIKTGTIQGGKVLSSVTSENGVTRYQENYDYEGSHINRDYSQSTDATGKVKSQQYQYTITDPNGNKILSVNRSWNANSDGTTTTTINGRTYTASFDDKDMKITVTQDDGSSTTIDIRSKLAPYNPNDPYQKQTFGSQEAMQKAFFESLKSAPADSLMALGSKNIKTIKITDDLNSSLNSDKGILKSGINPNTMAHELGHGIDFNGKPIGHKLPGEISGNPDLIRIYNEECASFSSQYTDPNQAIIHYFLQTGGSGGSGLSELVAETNMLMTTYGLDVNRVKTRSEYLVRYFPQTVAKVAELLGY